MKEVRFIYGSNVYDFYILPTILISGIESSDGVWHHFITLEWLGYYIGISIVKG